jgi:S1-C subfamily serine protease
LAICNHSRFSFWILVVAVGGLLACIQAIAADSPTSSYQTQSSTEADPHLHSLDEYIHSGAIEVSPLGLQLREDERKLKSGVSAKGLLIVGIAKGSPGENAGLRAVQQVPQQVLAGIAVAGSMAFPPAIILVPLVASLPIGRDGDFIIAVDGTRVRSVLDFDDDIRDVQPGEIVYLTIVRSGSRMQVQVLVPPIAE